MDESRVAIETLARLTEEAFEGDLAQGLLGNLRDLREGDWTALPRGRSCRSPTPSNMSDGRNGCTWTMPSARGRCVAINRRSCPRSVRSHVRTTNCWSGCAKVTGAGSRRYARCLTTLHSTERLTNWGEHLPTRDLIRILIGHDFYHAGEINKTRALLQGTDRWPY